MGKISKAKGASVANETIPVVHRAMLGGEHKSVGINSSVSSKSENTKNDKEKQSRQQPAQTMENPSKKTKETDSTVPLTGGVGRKTEAQKSDKKPTPSKRANTRVVSDDDFDDFD